MDSSNKSLFENLWTEMEDSCNAIKEKIDEYTSLKLLSPKPDPKLKCIGDACVYDYLAQAECSSFFFLDAGDLTKVRSNEMQAKESVAARLNCTPDLLLSIIGKLSLLADEPICEEDLPICPNLPPLIEHVRVPRHKSRPQSPGLGPGPGAAATVTVVSTPEEIKHGIKALLEQIESLIFYDCLKIFFQQDA